MKKRIAPLVLFFLLFAGVLSAQSSEKSEQVPFDTKGDQMLQKALEVYHKSFDSTFIYLSEAAKYYEQASNWEKMATCYTATSNLYSYQGDYLKYDSMMKINLRFADEKLDQNSEAYGAIINNQGINFSRMRNFDQAFFYLRKSLAIDRQHQQKLNIASTLSNLGNAYFRRGDYEEALHHYKEAYQFHLDTLGKSWRSASLSIKIGNTYRAKEAPKEASRWFQDAVAVLTKEQKKLGNSEVVLKPLIGALFNLAELRMEQKDWSAAKENVFAAQQISRYIYVANQGRADDILGEIYFQQNHYKQALHHFFQSKKLVEKEYQSFDKHPSVAEKNLKIASVYQAMEEWEKALQYYHQALEISSHGFLQKNHYLNPVKDSIYAQLIGVDALAGKGEILHQLFQKNKDLEALAAAQKTYRLALQLISDIRQAYLGDHSKELLSSKVLPLFENAIQVAIAYHRRTGQSSYLHEAFTYAESNKAILLMESINELAAKKIAGIPDSLLHREKQLVVEITYFEKSINEEKQKSGAQNTRNIAQLESKVFQLRQKHQALIKYLESNFPKYFQLKHQSTIASVEAIQQNLDASSAILEYFIGNRFVYIFTLTANEIQVDQFAKEATFIQEVNTIRQLIRQPPSTQSEADYLRFVKTAHGLYQKLIPVNFAPKIKNLIVIPDDLLSFIPFEVLLAREPKDQLVDYSFDHLAYLLNDFNISYSYSSSLLLSNFAKSQFDPVNQFVGFAPTFESSAKRSSTRNCQENKLYSLHCSEQEVLRIQNILGGKIFTADQADLSAFEQHAPQSNIIHLATHACIDESNHQFNKIFFADDYLSNNDLYNYFFQSQLAVLSACNTGAGHLVKGEGVMSLSRGFILAGCPSVLMSLWSVDDCATSDIMFHFYQALKAGQDKNEALKNAKINYLRNSKKAQQHPYYWAAFVQFGNTDFINFSDKKPFFNYSFLSLFAVILIELLFIFLFKRGL